MAPPNWLLLNRRCPSGCFLNVAANFDRQPRCTSSAGCRSGFTHSVSRTLQIHSAQPNLARSPTRCSRSGGRALLPAPRVRLARDPNRCRRRFGNLIRCGPERRQGLEHYFRGLWMIAKNDIFQFEPHAFVEFYLGLKEEFGRSGTGTGLRRSSTSQLIA